MTSHATFLLTAWCDRLRLWIVSCPAGMLPRITCTALSSIALPSLLPGASASGCGTASYVCWHDAQIIIYVPYFLHNDGGQAFTFLWHDVLDCDMYFPLALIALQSLLPGVTASGCGFPVLPEQQPVVITPPLLGETAKVADT
eukprot:2407619-Heterocapsa_arctica.AAC.1